MSVIEVPQPKDDGQEQPQEEDLPEPWFPRDEDHVRDVHCPFMSGLQIFQPHPRPEVQSKIGPGGQLMNVPSLRYFPVTGASALYAPCNKRCALFDHERSQCSQLTAAQAAAETQAALRELLAGAEEVAKTYTGQFTSPPAQEAPSA